MKSSGVSGCISSFPGFIAEENVPCLSVWKPGRIEELLSLM